MDFGFSALLYRMNYINRWGLMRNSRIETLSEHTLMTAFIAHILAMVANNIFNAGVDSKNIVCCALYHDVCEILTGDLPTPVKYQNEGIRTEYKNIEEQAATRLLKTLPAKFAEELKTSITGEELSEREKKIIKAADKISALVKCIEEAQSGNREFDTARASTAKILDESDLPEVAYYIKNFIPPFTATLDQLLEEDS